MSFAHLRSSISAFVHVAREYVVRDHGHRVNDEMPMVGGHYVDYSEPSEKAINSVDPEMKAFIARSKIVSVEGEL